MWAQEGMGLSVEVVRKKPPKPLPEQTARISVHKRSGLRRAKR